METIVVPQGTEKVEIVLNLVGQNRTGEVITLNVPRSIGSVQINLTSFDTNWSNSKEMETLRRIARENITRDSSVADLEALSEYQELIKILSQMDVLRDAPAKTWFIGRLSGKYFTEKCNRKTVSARGEILSSIFSLWFLLLHNLSLFS